MDQRDQKYAQDITTQHRRASATSDSSLQRDEMVWNEQMQHKQKIMDLQRQLLQQQQALDLFELGVPRNDHVKMEDVSLPSDAQGNTVYLGECDRGKGVPRRSAPVYCPPKAVTGGMPLVTQTVPVGLPPANTVGGSLRCPILSNSKINPPPAFEPTKFVAWKREFLFWRDIYIGMWRTPNSFQSPVCQPRPY